MTDADPASRHDALLTLIACGGASAPRRNLLEAYATPEAALAAGVSSWRALGLGDTQIAALRRPDPDLRTRGHAWLANPNHHLLGWHDPDYPSLLRRSPNPPLALFVAGDPARLWHPAVAVVGSRSPTPGGRDNASAFSRALAGSGLAVSSGLAAGVDTAAHAAALAVEGLTIAVLGTGPESPTRPATAPCTDASRPTARWSASTCPAPAPSPDTFPVATGSSPGCRWARW